MWRLPLTAHAAHEFVLALLEEPVAGRDRLQRLLPREPELLLWILCNTAAWKEAPPPDAAAPIDWLYAAAIPSGLFQVEPEAIAPTPDAPCPSVAANDEIAKHATTARSVDPTTARDVFRWLSACGPLASAETLRDCPWVPRWLFPGVSTPPSIGTPLIQCLLEATSTDRDDVQRPDAALGRLLPQVLTKIRRLDELEKQFAATLEREKISALRELAYGASHEVNNPLANIATRAQSLLRDESDPERKRKLSTIAAQAFRAHEMIADMMLFAKPPTPVFQQVDVRGVVRKVISEMVPDAALQQTQLVFDPSPDPQIVSADVTQLGVAVKALVRNSLEALGSGGTVAVAVQQIPRTPTGVANLEIAVRDSGPGITSEVRRHLFDPFFSGREAGRGLGFGLSKCWRIAELHGGTIQVESEPGFGATFTLQIPSQRD